VRLHDELQGPLLSHLDEQLGQHGLGPGMQVDLRLLQQHRAARRGKMGHGKYRQHLGDADAHIAQVGRDAILMHHHLVAAGASHLLELQPLRYAHALQPMGNARNERALLLAAHQGAGKQRIDGALPMGAHLAGLGAVPDIVALGLEAQRAKVDDALQGTAQCQAHVLKVFACSAQGRDGLCPQGNRALRRHLAARAPGLRLITHKQRVSAPSLALDAKARLVSGQLPFLDDHAAC